MLSIVVPTYNEDKTNFLEKSLSLLSEFPEVEIIVVDSYSTDNTRKIVARSPRAQLIDCKQVSRAERLNKGISLATNELILLHHPRSLLVPEAIRYLLKNHTDISWGGFTHKFDHNISLLLNFTSWYSNYIRADLRSIFYLDHCIFAKKSLLNEVGLIPGIDIFEDTELSLRLRSITRGKRLKFISLTSAIRFKTNGVISQCFMNQKLKWKYYFKTNHKLMNDQYERGLNLNTTYPEKESHE